MFSSCRTLRQARSSTSCRFIKTIFDREENRSGYSVIRENIEKKNLISHVTSGFNMLKTETKKWLVEQKEHVFCLQNLFNKHDEVDPVWRFNDASSLKEWIVTCDSDYEQGFSTASLALTSEGKGVFSGTLSTRLPLDGKIRKAGYCNLRAVPYTISFFRERPRDWTTYNFIFLRVRGDGRPYLINIGNSGYFEPLENDLYTYAMYTRGGRHWQDVKIPFSKFLLGSMGKIQDRQSPLELKYVTDFNITLADNVNGPFSLEIDYIGIGSDWAHMEKFAYETYKY